MATREPFAEPESQAERDGWYASLRDPGYTYLFRTTIRPGDAGVPARYIHKVFDTKTSTELEVMQ